MVSVVGWKVFQSVVRSKLKLGREPSISAFRLISNHAPARKKAI